MPAFQMALTPVEFGRQLQPVLAGWHVESFADSWHLHRDGRQIRIVCQPLGSVRLGALELPRLDVMLSFSGCDTAEEASFLDMFWQHFRRGGG